MVREETVDFSYFNLLRFIYGSEYHGLSYFRHLERMFFLLFCHIMKNLLIGSVFAIFYIFVDILLVILPVVKRGVEVSNSNCGLVYFSFYQLCPTVFAAMLVSFTLSIAVSFWSIYSGNFFFFLS